MRSEEDGEELGGVKTHRSEELRGVRSSDLQEAPAVKSLTLWI